MADARPILIVEDDAATLDRLIWQLDSEGFAASGVRTAAGAMEMLRDGGLQFDAVVLDLTLPDGDGRDICAWMRRRGMALPILMLSGADREQDLLEGFAAGADDYLAKPYQPAVLAAHLRTQICSYERSEPAVLEIGPFDLPLADRCLVHRETGAMTRLTGREVDILRELSQAGEFAVERADLLESVWGYSAAMNTHTVETHIYRLRKKIEPDTGNPCVILTEGSCYRLDPKGGCEENLQFMA